MSRLNLAHAEIGRITHSERMDRPRLIRMEPRRGSAFWREVAVTEDQFRIASQYAAARERLAKAQAARDDFVPPPAEPPLDAVEPQDKLTSRQESFCQHYAARPVATRAAMLAGYSTASAASRGWKLLRHPLVLARLAELRAERKLRYRIDADTIHDKIETIYFEALESGSHAAAIAAIRFQAALGGLLGARRSSFPAKEEDATGKDEG